jgi:hypothetical protein
MPTYLYKGSDSSVRNFTPAQPVPAGPVELGVVFDRSASMAPLRQAVLDGFNMLLEEQKKLQFPARFSLCFFNDQVLSVRDGVPFADIGAMKEPITNLMATLRSTTVLAP